MHEVFEQPAGARIRASLDGAREVDKAGSVGRRGLAHRGDVARVVGDFRRGRNGVLGDGGGKPRLKSGGDEEGESAPASRTIGHLRQ